jgi:hypothetical protein
MTVFEADLKRPGALLRTAAFERKGAVRLEQPVNPVYAAGAWEG